MRKRKLAELEAETEANAKVEREAKRINLEARPITEDVRLCPAAKEFPGFGYIWELFLQSTNTPNPDHHLPDIEKPPVASDTDAPPIPNAYNLQVSLHTPLIIARPPPCLTLRGGSVFLDTVLPSLFLCRFGIKYCGRRRK